MGRSAFYWKMRKLKRIISTNHFKFAGGLLVASSCSIALLMCFWNRKAVTDHKVPATFKTKEARTEKKFLDDTEASVEYLTDEPSTSIPLNDLYADLSRSFTNDSFEFDDYRPVSMINTPGCKIPSAMINYEKYSRSEKQLAGTCGNRAVFMKKVDIDKVQAFIKPKIMKLYLRKGILFECCYQFLTTRNEIKSKITKDIKCVKFKDSAIITLETDFISVKCYDYVKQNISYIIYEDVYAFVKSINVSKRKDDCRVKYNVLMIGMDSMSRPRFTQTLPRTVHFFKTNNWLDFRGYHKVEDNTMAALTGRNESSFKKLCFINRGQCNNLLISDKFKQAGYVTAYGEDYLTLRDTSYAFKVPPTDHYMEPFSMKGDREINKSLVCAGKVSSGHQLISYALDFVNNYINEQFFGLFWMNSFSHNINSRPQEADALLENFFNKLTYTRVLKNTFVIVFSNHGILFGDHRLKIESYYDERLPILFIWAPNKFNRQHSDKIMSLIANQFQLVTPYDLYNTLVNIRDISLCRNTTEISETCPNCHGVFEEVNEKRKCQDVGIHDKWCSCHKLYPLPAKDAEGVQSVYFVVTYIQVMIKFIKSYNKCWECVRLSLKNILRLHYYYNDDNKGILFYVVAFAMTPGNVSYEATVLLKDGKRELIGPISVISPYRGLGKCALKPKDRLFCICEKIDGCSNLIELV